MPADDTPPPEAFGPVVRVMRERLTTGLTLADMADVACLSPFHFLRVFHRAFGVPPGHFFTALRMDAAKRLLLTTTESVVDVCYGVGYSSPGTFSTRFAQLVGETPSGYRALPHVLTETGLWDAGLGVITVPHTNPGPEMGRILGPPSFQGLIFVGAFAKRVPQALPLAGVLLAAPGTYCFRAIPDGLYHVMVAAVPTGEPRSLFLPGPGLLVGSGARPLVVSRGAATGPVDVPLRPPRDTDPPIVVALPSLLRRQVARLSLPQPAP